MSPFSIRIPKVIRVSDEISGLLCISYAGTPRFSAIPNINQRNRPKKPTVYILLAWHELPEKYLFLETFIEVPGQYGLSVNCDTACL